MKFIESIKKTNKDIVKSIMKTNKDIVNQLRNVTRKQVGDVTFGVFIMLYMVGVVIGTMSFFWETIVHDQTGMVFPAVLVLLVSSVLGSVMYMASVYTNYRDGDADEV